MLTLIRHHSRITDMDFPIFGGFVYEKLGESGLALLIEHSGERAILLEQLLWRLARRHVGGRIWRDRLWTHSERNRWKQEQWQEFAHFCGATGDLSKDVALKAGPNLPIAEKSNRKVQRKSGTTSKSNINSAGNFSLNSKSYLRPISAHFQRPERYNWQKGCTHMETAPC